MAIQLGSAYGKVTIDASGVRKGTRQAESALVGLQKRGGAAMAALGLSVAGLGIALGKAVDKTTDLASEFQTDMTSLSLATGEAGISMDELHGAAIEVGGDARLLGVSASGAADAMTGLYRSGLSTAVIFGDLKGYMSDTTELGGALRGAIDMAAASELDMVRASDLAATTLATFGAELETDAEKAEFINVALDNFVRAADASVAEVSDLAAALENVGPDAARLGFSVQDVNNALALLSTRGIAGAEAGTALKSMFLNMNRQTDKTVGALDELNVSLYDSHGQMRSLPDVIGQLERAFSTLTDEQRDHYMQTLAGTYGIKAMSTLIAEGTEGWYTMSAATERATGIQEKAAAMAATHAGRVEALEGNVETLGITIGEKLLPVATDWVEWAIEMVDQHGPALVKVTGHIAGAATALSEALQGQGSAELQTGLQMVGLVGALGVGAVAFSKLQPVIAGVGTALSDAVVGVQLMRGGASAAQVATLGWTAALGPLVAGLAAAGAVLLAVNKRMEVHKQVQEGTADVGDQWTRYLSTQAAETETATEMADAYLAKQSELAQIYEESGVLVKGAIDRQAILTASTDDLHGVLMETSDSYEDYLAAVRRVNQANMVEVETGEMVTGGYHRMTEAIQQDLLPAYSEQTWALLRGGEVMETGFLQAQLMASGMADLSGAMDENATEAAGLAATHQQMSEMVAEAWTEFSESVRTGVDSALQAYREGNHEMLAEQKRALAEMLWDQTDTMVALGEITEGQALSMKVAIADEYGVIIDETDLATGKLLGMYADWASGGATSADDIMAFLRNIGMETETLANDTEAEVRRALEEHRAFSTGVSEYGGAAALAIDEMSTGIGGSLGEMDTSLQSTRTELGLVEAALLGLPTEHTFTLHLETEGSLPSLPNANHKYGEEYGYNAAGTEFWRGGLTFAGEEGPELLNLPRGTEILNARETAAMIASAASLAERLQAGGLAGGAVAGAAGGTAAQYHDRRKVEMVNYVRDQVDVELLARRVAGYITQRQR